MNEDKELKSKDDGKFEDVIQKKIHTENIENTSNNIQNYNNIENPANMVD